MVHMGFNLIQNAGARNRAVVLSLSPGSLLLHVKHYPQGLGTVCKYLWDHFQSLNRRFQGALSPVHHSYDGADYLGTPTRP